MCVLTWNQTPGMPAVLALTWSNNGNTEVLTMYTASLHYLEKPQLFTLLTMLYPFHRGAGGAGLAAASALDIWTTKNTMALEERCKNAFPSVGATCTLPQGLAFKRREALEVIKGDLSQWLSRILKTDIPPEKFLDTLDTGVLLCKLARLIQAASKTSKNRRVEIPIRDVKCNEKAAKEPFVARDNVSNFISWCRELGVEEAVIFESDGLVLHRDEKRVILCLLDVARFAEKVGISPPQLVRMEREIEMLETAAPPMPKKKPPNESEKTLKDKVH